MRSIFSLVKSGFRNVKDSPDIEIVIELDPPHKYATLMYYLYVSAFLPIEFWPFFTRETQQRLIKALKEFMQFEDFRISENQNFEMFDQLCELAKTEPEVISILDNIIISHQDNSFLTVKFEHYVYMA